MIVTPLLYVGTGPDYKESHRYATADQAAHAVSEGHVAVVPTTDIAREALVLLGAEEWWARFVTTPSQWTDMDV